MTLQPHSFYLYLRNTTFLHLLPVMVHLPESPITSTLLYSTPHLSRDRHGPWLHHKLPETSALKPGICEQGPSVAEQNRERSVWALIYQASVYIPLFLQIKAEPGCIHRWKRPYFSSFFFKLYTPFWDFSIGPLNKVKCIVCICVGKRNGNFPCKSLYNGAVIHCVTCMQTVTAD